jgi:hypothetical protein
MGVVFGLFAGFYYWIEYLLGLKYSTNLGKLHFYLTFVGVNLTFFPMHFLGLSGMPRRIPDYPDIYWTWNYYSSIGSLISVVGVLVFFYIMFNMLFQLTIGIQIKNSFYVLISTFNKIIALKYKKLEYNFIKIYLNISKKLYILILNLSYKFNINYIYILLYFINIIYQLIHSIFFYYGYKIIFKTQYYYFFKYDFNTYFSKSNFYVYLDRFYYSIFVLDCIKIWNLSLNIYEVKNFENNKLSINSFYNLLTFFSYNYILIYVMFIYINTNICIYINKLKFKYVIFNLFTYKFLNSIFNFIYIYIYKNEIIKNYKK